MKCASFQLESAEAAAAGKGFQNKDSLLGTGMKFEGEKYFVLQADDDRIIGKKGSTGFFIYKTGQGQELLHRFRGMTILESCENLMKIFGIINFKNE